MEEIIIVISYHSVYFHFVFRTKHSHAVFSRDGLAELFKYIGGICKNVDCKLLWINGMAEHIHLAVSLSPNISFGNFIRDVKRASSLWMSNNHELFPKFHGWAEGYFVSSFSRRDLESVINYIKNQQAHHACVGFQEEMDQFFELAGLHDKLQYFIRD